MHTKVIILQQEKHLHPKNLDILTVVTDCLENKDYFMKKMVSLLYQDWFLKILLRNTGKVENIFFKLHFKIKDFGYCNFSWIWQFFRYWTCFCLDVYKYKLFYFRCRFQDICDSKVRIPGLTVMKDVSFNKDRPNERIINKIQDFMFDDVLFEYCRLPQVRLIDFYLKILN